MPGVLDKSPEVMKGDTVVFSKNKNFDKDDSYALLVEMVRGEQVMRAYGNDVTQIKGMGLVIYSYHLNAGQVWYSNGPNMSSCQLV